MILVTHKHADHAGGNIEIRNEYPSIDVIATSYEEVPGMTSPVKHGDSIFLGSLAIRVIHSPCHTRGHVLYYVTGNDQSDGPPILFSGDTLFVGGCGRFFEGTAEDMLKNMDTISTLPPETQVFCAHEYTESNLKFLATLDSELCSADLSRIQGLRRDGMPTIPTTVEAERRYNLFMKCREARVQELLGCSGSAVDTMAKLRKLKNAF
jgi:hydroxyacylglutathione hydrolase